MKAGDLRLFKDTHSRYPGASFLVLEVEAPGTRSSTSRASVTFLVNGRREFGWNWELLNFVSEAVNESEGR